MQNFLDSFFDVHFTKHPLVIIEFPEKCIIFIQKISDVSICFLESILERVKLFGFHPRALDSEDVKYLSDVETRHSYYCIACAIHLITIFALHNK